MITYLDADIRPLEAGWTLLVCEPGTYDSPKALHRPSARLQAPVPDTVAQALTKAGLFDPDHPSPLHGKDIWYLRPLTGEQPGPAVLRFEGLATIAEVYLNDRLILSSDSMFEAHDVDVILTGSDDVSICFRALRPHLERRGPRARWRPQMMSDQGLRLVRTTALGHMPGWCPDIHAVGPYRPISLIRPGASTITDLALHSDLDEDGTGLLDFAFQLIGAVSTMSVTCAGETLALKADADGHVAGQLRLPTVAPWWPRTHGEPVLHDIRLTLDGKTHSLGLTGFRRVRIDRGADGKDFAIFVNGVKIFCRGAVWTNADITRLPGTAEDYASWLSMAADAGMNMIRIGGTMTYESADFFRLCDRLGLMVWQDIMLANFDYPAADEAFSDHIRREVEQLLSTVQASPSLAILCGGSEVYQQGAMLGLPETNWKGPVFTSLLPQLCARFAPHLPYVENSPMGGAMPFSPDTGITHYYGVGAYCRPLEDARRAHVRFAAECLAFAHVPQQQTLDRHLSVSAVHDPRWKARVPRDRGASWDFEDIRDHYLALLYDVDPARPRRENPARYLHLSRAVSGEVLEETYAEWRRPGSSCNGALIWTFQDLTIGPGWGLVDATGTPKPVWYAARRAFNPVRITMTDEGTNGLDVHLCNDTVREQTLTLDLTCLRDGKQPVVAARRAVTLTPRSSITLHATDLFGAFFDTTYAFRFGPPAHDVTVATLSEPASGEIVSQSFHFPQGRAQAMHDAEIRATLSQEKDGWWLMLETDRLAQSVHIALENGRSTDDFFHLAPGFARRVRLLTSDKPNQDKPSGEILSGSASRRFRF
ncbi:MULTISPECIES: glycosyl hydrolase 2 galactose-binding domain-containing protein [Rhizobium/Agrobacterium group]|uniref:beta-mannosidase n=2 Tax=Rhizobium/Agrobacterium group TaxID=227290 RepID=B9K2D8_ALLAM|nr:MULTISPECIES: glycoside hydrolase family 2 protein [Rhizobium/Agrobacterium group]ACM39036.1 mannosidase [Allorhizobium ampelinum S4]MUO31060.1 glycoside hydrolase family 2 protein [Agrobacterium vitis]MUO44490.1 glycoside hydrolase family 2 protein [Agrobacterium vitis]MUP12606.1 glycoside hydrolase family 2 protein [Agrobacterium vitis]